MTIFLNVSLAKKYLEIFQVRLCKFFAIGPFQTCMLRRAFFVWVRVGTVYLEMKMTKV